MKLVSIEVRAAVDGEVVISTIIEQRSDGNAWREVDRQIVRSDDPLGATRKVMLEDNERVIVDGRREVEVVLDREQGAAVERPVGPGGNIRSALRPDITLSNIERDELAAVPGPLPLGDESEIGVWREAGEQNWSRTGKPYRIY
jgi:hypothetical protein